MKANCRLSGYKFEWMVIVAGLCLVAAIGSGQAQRGNGSDNQGQPRGWCAPLESGDIGNPATHGSTQATNGGLSR
jgi:hypothetical protein